MTSSSTNGSKPAKSAAVVTGSSPEGQRASSVWTLMTLDGGCSNIYVLWPIKPCSRCFSASSRMDWVGPPTSAPAGIGIAAF
jgi:hypothetical protein